MPDFEEHMDILASATCFPSIISVTPSDYATIDPLQTWKILGNKCFNCTDTC